MHTVGGLPVEEEGAFRVLDFFVDVVLNEF